MSYYKAEVANRGTMYRIHHVVPDAVQALMEGGPVLVLCETGWGMGYGEWMTIHGESIAWSYVAEKMPELARRDGDREGWVKAFAAVGITIFGWELGAEDDE